MNINSLDLNLLLVLEALLEERNVTRAAARVGLSQPATSSALSRLRAALRDPLFRRTAAGMSPTPRAMELAGPVRMALAQIRSALSESPGFVPSASARSFRIGMTDYAEYVFLGHLLSQISRDAPEVQILVRRLDRIFIPPESDLQDASLDAAIGFFPNVNTLAPVTRSLDLYSEKNVCIARNGHPILRGSLTLRRFAAAGHVGVFYRNEVRGLVDSALASHGLRRKLRATTPHFLSAAKVVAESNLIAVVPAGLAARFRKLLPLDVRNVPLHLPPLHMRLLWHERVTSDAGHQWLRTLITSQFSPPPHKR
jgi:DNA-binding transcriptional LysR family regulator